MSDVQNVALPGEAAAITAHEPQTTTEHTPEATTTADAPAVESQKPEDAAETTPAATSVAAPAEEKVVEPITEGQLAYKGPGLLKQFIPSKKEFWLSDEATSPQDLNSYMRGEKPDVAHPVVAWASQTGNGLLFFNKKGDTTRKQPGGVLALYEATDLKKVSPHEIGFKLHGHEHTLKATSDAERDGWYLSLEKAIESGKASRESVRESEGYKTEIEKLNKPHVAAAGAAAAGGVATGGAAAATATKRAESKPKKSTEINNAQRQNSETEDEDKKKQKSRSTSRGVLDRLKAKKDEKKEEKAEKKEEKAEKKEEKKEEKAEAKAEKADVKPTEESKVDEIAPVGGAVAGGALAGTAVAEGAHHEDKKQEAAESPVEPASEEKPKPAKRGSIFGKMQAGWGSMKSPTKEKDQKEAELKPEVPPKDEPISEAPPQLPETTVEPPTEADETKPEAAKEEVSTPSKEKRTYLSGLSFMNKRNRSVSPSTPMKEAPNTETATEAPKEDVAEPAKVEEPTAETAAPVEPVEKPAEKTEEPAKTETPNKRQSVLGSLGRRASKAFRGIQAPKKENAAPTTSDATKEETTEAAPVAETPAVNGETKPAESKPAQIGDVVPAAITIGEPQHSTPTVTASA